jgi:mRNA-degrading endonuclease RelE of RelBE toxin-antitoxin system
LSENIQESSIRLLFVYRKKIMPYKVNVHEVVEADLDALRRAGLKQLIKKAVLRMNRLAETDDPRQHNNVTELRDDAPHWYRYKTGRLRIIFRLRKSDPRASIFDIIEITMIDLRDDKTYGKELIRRYKLLEGPS